MGQKIHPIGLRVGIIRGWDSRWFQKKHYVEWLHEDIMIRNFIRKTMRNAGLSRIEIERADKVNVTIQTAKPGIVIGKRGAGIEDLRKKLIAMTGKEVKVNVQEVKQPELDARLVAENIVEQLEKRVAFRRAMKQALGRSMRAGAKGIKIQCGGRLGGAEIARSERTFEGKVPLHTLRADIDYAMVEAYTTYGRIGVKVWIYRGDILPAGKKEAAEAASDSRERRFD
ncbi:MAG: 30S ribosomal protein S3 [bacterium]